MIVYANGCSHTAAAEAVVPDCFAVDDGRHGIDRRPHPQNLAASWCTLVARALGAELVCDAESGGSNARILRTTRAWIDQNRDRLDQTVMILQWTTWEREEWLHNNTWYQVNASGTDWLPNELQDRYRQYIIDIDWTRCTNAAHQEIWQLHQELVAQKVRHLFFSGHSTFSDIGPDLQQDWQNCYMYPYDRDQSYHNWLVKNGGRYANASSYHFDAASHRLWADYVLQYINRNQILASAHEISAD
jgi:hypothetical protein